MPDPTTSYTEADPAVKPTPQQVSIPFLYEPEGDPAPDVQIACCDERGKRLYSIYCERCGRYVWSFYLRERRDDHFRALFMHSVGCVCRLNLDQIEVLLTTASPDHAYVRMWAGRLAGALQGLGIDPEEARLYTLDSFPLSEAMRTRLQILRAQRRGDYAND